MNEQLIQISLIALCMLEVVLCYAFVSHMVRLRIKPEKLEWLVVIIGVVLIGCGLGFYRNILFFANNVWIWTMILCSAWMLVILRKNIIETIELVVVYYGAVTMLDFFFGFLVMNHLQETFWDDVYFMTLSWWSVLIYVLARVVVLIIILVIRKYLPRDFSVRDGRLVFLLFAVGMCVLVRFYHLLLWHLAETVPYVKVQTVCVSVLTVLILLCVAMLLFFREKAIRQEKDIVMIKSEAQERQFFEVQAVTDKNYGLVHDMKNHVLILQELAKKEDIKGVNAYLSQIAESSFAITHQKWTGCRVLDILLNQKQRNAEQAGICFTVISSGTIRFGLSDMELVSLFGNLLDNAVEACQKIPMGRKEIQTIIERKNDMVYVKVSNSVSREPAMKDGELVSTKKEKGRHGYGLKNVKAIIQKYGGQMQYKYHDKVFSVLITFFDNDKDDEKE